MRETAKRPALVRRGKRVTDIEFSGHARDMLHERNIPEEWVHQALRAPDRTATAANNTVHYIKAIAEREGRHLRVVVNPHVAPPRVVTVFFDRRLRRAP